jgi:glycosyltransferase involved in cell wall biosynthesis
MVLISILIPVLNETEHIDKLISSFIQMPPDEKEILLIDGGSTDGTREKIKFWVEKNDKIILVENKSMYVSPGFNKAFDIAKGEYIGFLGAHAHYPNEFLITAISELDSGSCDAVGGPLKQLGKSHVGKAISFVMSSRFGVGNVDFRVSEKRKYVQSVAFAIYKREIFENIGLLDEELIRNQDDEFHYRLNKNGYRMLMVPEMASEYYVRESIKLLYKQYFGYGLFKPLVFIKLKYGIKFRHIIPPLFSLYILLLPMVIYFPIFLVPILFYLFVILLVSIVNPNGLLVKFVTPIVFFTIHFAYGLGFILGLLKLLFKIRISYFNHPRLIKQ